MAKTDITLTRAAADQIQTTLGKARQAIRQINPTLAQQLNECVKALGPETKAEEPVDEPEESTKTESQSD